MGGGDSPGWSAGGEELLYIAPGGKLMSVKLKVEGDSVEPSAPRELFSVPGPYQVAQDGKRFLVLAGSESGPPPLQLVLNWPALLKKRTPSE
jgi:hypothetical protein